jgi:hypothetical protein
MPTRENKEKEKVMSDPNQPQQPDQPQQTYPQQYGQDTQYNPQQQPQYNSSPQQPVMPMPPHKRRDDRAKKPIYKRWWFWVLVILAAFIIIGAINGTNPSATGPTAQASSSPAKTAEETKAPEVQTLTASYNGDTADGTQIQDGMQGITITATYTDGSVENVTDGWKITNPDTLHSGQTQTFTVEYKGKTADFQVVVPISEDQYKASAQQVAYSDLARSPDNYKGKVVHFRGQIIQVIEGTGGASQYRISVTQDEYGYWDDTMLVQFTPDANSRFLEDDVVEFWGTSIGVITYESTMGGNITIPGVDAQYMTLSK